MLITGFCFLCSIYLPDMKKLKHLTERYKNLGHYVLLEAHQTGKLVFKLVRNNQLLCSQSTLKIELFIETMLHKLFVTKYCSIYGKLGF